MSNIVDFPGTTYGDIPPDRVLESAIGKMDTVIIIGYDDEGMEYFASSTGDATEMVWLLERMKLKLLHKVDE